MQPLYEVELLMLLHVGPTFVDQGVPNSYEVSQGLASLVESDYEKEVHVKEQVEEPILRELHMTIADSR